MSESLEPRETATRREPIAIVGVSALFPGSTDAGGFWRDILAGRDLITEVPESHWLVDDFYDPDPKAPDKTYSKRGAFLSPTDFDPMEFGIPPTIAPATDSAQLLALIVARKVLDDAAQGQFESLDKDRISVILGVTSAQELLATMVGRLQRPIWVKALREAGFDESQVEDVCDRIADHYVPWQESTFPGLLGNVVAGRIANRFNLGGTNCVTDAACASAFASISMAVNELQLGDSDMVISGGVDTLNDIFMYMCFSKTPALSPTGDCRPFSDRADGTLMGEGLGMVALKRLSDAERDGDRIYAVLRGVGSSSDGRAKSVYAPLAEGQAKALRRAYDHAGYSPATVELVEAHGTGTKAGDAAEAAGLKQAFGDDHQDPRHRQWCALGSVKSQIGHTKSAAGAAGLFKTVMALHHKVLPPTIKVDKPNPKLGLEDSPFYLNTEARPWIRGDDHPRRASVSSFGFGGSNFHLALEEYRGPGRVAPRFRPSPSELVVLHADSPRALAERCAATRDQLAGPGALAWLARESQESFDAAAGHRLAIVADDESDLSTKLERAAARLGAESPAPFSSPDGISYGQGDGAARVALLFPGQGSQYVGMGADLAITFEPARSVWDRAADLSLDGGVRLHDVVFPRPVFSDEERQEQAAWLTATEWAQPAIGAASLSQLALLQSLGLEPDCVGGHSYGEITALCAASVFDAAAMLRVARRRGELMREASAEPGAMTAVSCALGELQKRLAEWGSDVTVANHNGPRQVVLSGTAVAIAEVERRLESDGIRARRVPVSAAFHSPLVSPSCEPFHALLESLEMAAPRLDVYANAEAAPYPKEPAAIRRQLAEQIARPVRFVDQIEAMADRGVGVFVEVGPGSVLTSLVQKILEGRPHVAVSLDRKGRHGVTSLWHALGRLATAGQSLDFAALWSGVRLPEDPRTARKPKMALPITGTNYGKVYPPPGGAAALPSPNPPKSSEPAQIEAREPAQEASAVNRPSTPAPSAGPASTGLPSTGFAAPEPARAAPVPEAAVPAPAASAPEPSPPAGPAPAAAVPSTAPAPELQLAWVQAFQEAQRQTVDAHAAYQRSMADAQSSFLKTMEASFTGLGSLLDGAPARPETAVPETAAARPADHPVATALASVAPPSVAHTDPPAPQAPPVAPQPAIPEPAAPEVAEPAVEPAWPQAAEAPKPAPIPAPIPAPVATASAPSAAASEEQLQALMLDVVADKTGYPVEMLSLEMDMEADLGIDSIKRVEILSTMRERESSLPEVDTGRMAQLTTLGQIVEYMRGEASGPAVPAPAAEAPATAAESATPAAPVAPAASGPSHQHLQGLMLDVVADKTGYPAEMLELDMDMEADLGIDSIKRVEILSAMREREPALPEVDTGKMAQLRTLGQIVDTMRVETAEAPVPEPASNLTAAPAAASPGASGASHERLQTLMLDVVADKTGYPAEMLELDMDMEADLGIDSIKRVEILSAMREREPALPEVDTGKMAQLRTLGQIVDTMRGSVSATEAAPAAPAEASPAPPPSVETASAETAPPSEAPAMPPAELGRFALREIDAPAAGLAMPGLSHGPIAVTDDGAGVAAALVERLRGRGCTAAVVGQVPADATAVIFLGGLSPVADFAAGRELNRQAFGAARAVAAGFTAAGAGVFVTVQDTGGDFGLAGRDATRAILGGLAGLVKTAAREWPGAAVKAIDLERGVRSANELADALMPELFAGGPELEVGLHAAGRRTTLESYVAPLGPERHSTIHGGSVILASGGARGVTAATLVALARSASPRLVLLGRTPLEDEPETCRGVDDEAALKRALLGVASAAGESITPLELGARAHRIRAGREIRATLAELAAAGSEARYVSADVRDGQALDAALAEVRRDWGPITGIVHGAGVIADKAIAEKTLEQFDRVFDTKVSGLAGLLRATAGDPVEVLCLFSSVTARCGNTGQSDYAMANEVLNKMAAAESHRRGAGCRVKSLNWGPWEGGMVTPELETRFAELGVALIPLATGARMLVDELAAVGDASEQIEVVMGGAPTLGPMLSDGALEMDAFVSRESHPFLDSHVVGGAAVLPVVLALEWFHRLARAHRRDLEIVACRDLKVLRGIRLDELGGPPQGFRLISRQLTNGSGCELGLELRDPEGRPRYSALIDMAEPGDRPRPIAPDALLLEPWNGTRIYGDALFHGPALQVIREIEGISAETIAGQLSGGRDLGWSGRWQLDPALLDGGLQLAVLWFQQQLGGASLPLSVGALRTYAGGLLTGPIRAVVRCRPRDGQRAVSDVIFADEAGRVVAELEGVNLVRRPDLPATPAVETQAPVQAST